MRFKDLVRLAWRQLSERRLRTALTILAVSVGVIVIVVISSQVESVSQSVIRTLESLGPTTIIITPRGLQPLSDADVSRLSVIPGVQKVIPLVSVRGVLSGTENSVTVVGVSSEDLKELLGDVRLLDGVVYSDVPAPLAVVGYDVATNFGASNPINVGQPLLVNVGNSVYTLNVVGVLNYYGTSLLMVAQTDSAIFVPVAYLKPMVRGQGYTTIMVKASSIDDVQTVVDSIQQILPNVRATSVQQTLNTINAVVTQLNLLLVSIASTSFVAAGLGTFNIMTVSILERVREIGILKALGARDRTVLAIYLIQGLLIGVLGGVAGVGVGFVTSSFVSGFVGRMVGGVRIGGSPAPVPTSQNVQSVSTTSSITFTIPYINPYYVALAMALSVTVSLIASAYPSAKAARMNPVEALRYE